MLIVLLILWKLEHSRLGLIWKSIGMADNLAQSLGVDIARHKLLAFMLGCFFAGIAGAFYAHFIRFLFPPEFGFLMATNILVYNYVGGRGHFVGRDRRRDLPVAPVRALPRKPVRDDLLFDRDAADDPVPARRPHHAAREARAAQAVAAGRGAHPEPGGLTRCRSSRRGTSPDISAVWPRSTTSTSPSRRARSSASSVPTAPARRPASIS